MTAAEVAALFGVSEVRVRYLARKRGLKRQGKAWAFSAEDVERMRPAAQSGPIAKTTLWIKRN